MDFEQWKGFEKGEWKRKIDVRNFIQKNYTPYEGNATFLTGTTEKTKKCETHFFAFRISFRLF